jgi:hypothetical protein
MLDVQVNSQDDGKGYTIITAVSKKLGKTFNFDGPNKRIAKKKLAKFIWDNLPGVALHKLLPKI